MPGEKTTKAKTTKSGTPTTKRRRSKEKANSATSHSGVETPGTKPGRLPVKKDRVLTVVAENPLWTAQQVATAAKCTLNYVYSVWGKPKRKRGSVSLPDATVADFYRALKRVGVPRAKELIAAIEAYENA